MLVYGVFVSGFQVGEYEGYRARPRLEQVVTKVKTTQEKSMHMHSTSIDLLQNRTTYFPRDLRYSRELLAIDNDIKIHLLTRAYY